jgi:serine O-acetyltransferase
MKMKYILTPFLVLHFLLYKRSNLKDFIDADAVRFANDYWPNHDITTDNKTLLKVLLFCPEFRNVFYNRISDLTRKFKVGTLLEIILPKYALLSIGTHRNNIGKGLFIQHGNSTIIHAARIGSNCWVNQNVTIGDNGRGIPTIGNNVRIGTGAVVLGPILVGDNVVIGANATIVKDVPSNSVVVPSPSYIIKQNGESIYKKL